jgi:outer membrane receptor for ferrienterochelin and colicin
MKFKIIILLSLFGIAQLSNGQAVNCGAVSVEQSEYLYNIGRFNEAIATIKACENAKGLTYSNKIESNRILAMCYLAMDSVTAAELAITNILQLKDNYEADARDPQRYQDAVVRLKSSLRVNLVSSVSKKAEDIRRAPANITVVTQEEMLKRGYTDIIELLNDVAGFDISIAYGVNYAAVYQRGLRTTITEKTLLLVDGIEENDLWSNVADISRQYPITNIKRIEIIYGPASTMYGPNAFVGVINIITKEPDDQVKVAKKRNFGIHANVGYGTYNSRYADVTLAYKKNIFGAIVTARVYESDRHDMSSQPFFDYNPDVYNNVNYVRSMSIRTNAQQYITANNLPATSPYYNIFRTGATADSIVLTAAGADRARALDKSAYNLSPLGLKVGWGNPSRSTLINAKISVGNFSMGMQTWVKEEGAGTLYTDQFAAINNVYWIPNRSYFYFKFERQLSNTLQFSALSNYRVHALDNDTRVTSVSNYARGNLGIRDLVRDVNPAYNTTYFYQNSKQFRTEVKMLYTPTAKFYMLAGIEYRNSQLQGNYLNSINVVTPEEQGTFSGDARGGNQFALNDYGVYVQANQRFAKNFGITAGVRVDNNRIRQNGGFGTEVSPRLVVDYGAKGWVVKAIYSRGIMNVSNFTKFSTAGGRIPNPNLSTETINNFEAFISKKLSDNFEIDANIYEQIITNVVGVRALPNNTSQNQNLGEFQIFGIQGNLTYKHRNFNVTLNYAYTDPKQTKNDSGQNANLRVADIADYRINIIANYLAFKKLNINIRSNIVGARPAGVGTSVPLNNAQFPAVTLMNAAVTYQHIIPGVSIQVAVNNVFDKVFFHNGVRAADGINAPNALLQPGRNFFIRMNYDF